MNKSTLSTFESLDNRGIIVTQSSSCQGWYFYDVEDIEDGMVAAGVRSLYPTAEIAADAAFKYYKL